MIMKLMTPLLKRLMMFVIFFTVSFSIYGQQDTALVVYWKFDGSKNGKMAYDEISHQTDSIHYIFNGVKPYNDPERRVGILDMALVFDGFSSWIERPAFKFTTPAKGITISV